MINFKTPAATLARILYQASLERPDQVAVRLLFSRAPEQPIPYRELILQAGNYARLLARTGVKAGDVVILILGHGGQLLYAFFGAILQGAIPSIMPFLTEKLSPESYRRSLSTLFEITRPFAVVTTPEFASEVNRAIQPGSPVKVLLLSADEAVCPEIDLSELPGWQRLPTDIVLLQHSSGTTGLQKGVALSHQAVLNQLQSYAKSIRMTDQDVIVSWLPLYHDMGLIAGFLMPILCRVPLVLMSPFDWVRAPHRLIQAVSQYKGTLTWLPNFAYNFCAQKIRDSHLEGVDLTSWRAVINCSEPMFDESQRMFLERFEKYGLRPEALATCYAMAENVFAVTQGGIGEAVCKDRISQEPFFQKGLALPAENGKPYLIMLSAGRAIENTQVAVLNEAHEPLPERCIGEIALRSNCMLSGYYRREDLTEKAFHQGWYLTGDLGYTAAGEIYITGRKKDLIIIGGKNVYPQDLEYLASEVPGVHPGRVVAFGVANKETGTEDVVIAAEADTDDPAERAQIADNICQYITKSSAVALRTAFMVDRDWLIKTSSGKISRSANREKYLRLQNEPHEK